MKDLIEYLKGKKTYIIAIVIAVLGTLQGLGIFVLPNEVYAVLGALGFSCIRAGVNKVAKTVKPK